MAQRNAARHNFADQIEFVRANLLEGVSSPSPADARFDLIASNPPYIGRREAPTLQREVRDHEPEVALYGGEEGYELYAALVTQSAAHLVAGGIVVFELGHDSLPAVQPLFDTPEWTHVGVTNDLAGIPRVIAASEQQHVGTVTNRA